MICIISLLFSTILVFHHFGKGLFWSCLSIKLNQISSGLSLSNFW
uniref:Uncharacterized protein n=1 Tax=Anguilla anguilla TaxID=7936 RepID=A0A0E9RFZ8_ANGAN